MKRELKAEKGITMVALVVTIVVLLILASITLAALSGDDGIINNAKKAKEETEITQWEEKIDAAIIDAENKHRNPTLDDVIEELIKDGIIEDESKVDRNTGAITTKEPVHTIEGKLDDYLDKDAPIDPEPDPDPDEPVVTEHTVTYNYSANGGSGASKTSEKLEEGERIDLTVTANKSGYEFVGWNTNRNATTKIDSLTMKNEDVTLYAIYKKEIVGTFRYWTGTSTSSTTRTTTIYNTDTQGDIIAPTISNTSKNGTTYTAKGWSRTDDGNSQVTVESGESVTINGNTTFYAIYSGTTTSIFYYYSSGIQSSANGNATTNMNSSGEEKTETMSVPDEVTSSSGPYGTKYLGVATTPNSSTSADVNTSNLTYYAFYSVPITYYYGSGSYTTTTRRATSNGISYVTTVDNEYKPANYDNATFKTWSTSSTSEVAVSPSSTSQTTLYAVYTRTISVSFNYYGEYYPAHVTSDGTRTYISNAYSINQYEGTVTIPSSVSSSTGPGGTNYAFVSTSMYGTSSQTPTTASPTTYYAIYKNSVTITKKSYYNQTSYAYGTAYGYFDGKTKGATINLGSSSAPSGYSFRGWSTQSSATANIVSSTLYDVTANTTYYASYQKSVTVTYDANGGSVYPSSANATIYMNYQGGTSGEDVTLPTPTRNGFDFIAWYTSTGYFAGNAGASYNPTSNITLKAKWQQKSDLKEGNYVYYIDAYGTQRKCVVLWDNSSGYGTQIIPLETIGKVSLGSGFNYAAALQSYNDAINYLNKQSEYYADGVNAIDARCVGSVPNNKNSESGFSGSYKLGDDNYTKDYNQMSKLGILDTPGTEYWLASRYVGNSNYYSLRLIQSYGTLSYSYIVYNNSQYNNQSFGLRPVFTLSDNITIVGGSGTENDPYILGEN